MANRVAFQADKAELPPEILLRRKRQRHQDPDMGYIDCQPAAIPAAKFPAKAMEFLWAGHNNAHCTHVLPPSRKIPQSTRRRPE